MSPAVLLVLFSVLLALATARVVRRWLHPLVLYFFLWAATFLSLVFNVLNLRPLTGRASELLALGLAMVFVGAIGAQRLVDLVIGPRLPKHEGERSEYAAFPVLRLGIFLGVASLLLLYGVISYRNAIATAAGGIGFSSLDPQQVLFLSVYGPANHPGLAVELLDLAPLIAAGGVILGRRALWGYGFTILAIASVTTDPARTLTYYTLIASLGAWIYTSRHNWRALSIRRVLASVLAILVLFSIFVAYFLHEENVRHQTDAIGVVAKGYPPSLAPVTLYFAGGPVALSVAADSHFDPTIGSHLRTVWIASRVASLVDSRVQEANTVAQYVQVPYQYNTYTWIGDAYFDFGLAGIILEGLLLGAVSVVLESLARRWRTPLWTWFGAAWIAVLFSSVFTFEVFWLSTLVWVIAGVAIFLPNRGQPRPVKRPATTKVVPHAVVPS